MTAGATRPAPSDDPVEETECERIGAEVLAARPPQVPWKILCVRYGMCRARLVQLRREAAKRRSR